MPFFQFRKMAFYNPILDSAMLKRDLDEKVKQLQFLEKEENVINEKLINELRQHINNLYHLSNQVGLVSDTLTGKKYFLPYGKLKGGGPVHSLAKNVESHNFKYLCQNGSDALEKVKRELEILRSNRFRTKPGNRISKGIIINESKYPLVYLTCGSSSGYYFSDADQAFQGSLEFLGNRYENAITPGTGVGGFMHTKYTDTATCSCGYVSFMVPTEGKNYVVAFGFSNAYYRRSSVGIQIRGEDGVTDDCGRIKGHGVSATGTVTNMIELMDMVMHESYNSGWQTYTEFCRCFKVHCRFTNNSWGEFELKISNIN